MMYDELYEAWKSELRNSTLEKLPSDFYAGVAVYLKQLGEEGRMLDKRTVKARLMREEVRNAKQMLREVASARYRKLLKIASKGEKVPNEVLTKEEERIMNGVLPVAEAYRNFTKSLLHGRLCQMDVKQERGDVVLRFLKAVPAIIGANMKPYGPFKIEDVASLPTENAQILVKQGFAERIDVEHSLGSGLA